MANKEGREKEGPEIKVRVWTPHFWWETTPPPKWKCPQRCIGHTPVQAAWHGVAFAGGAFEVRSRPNNLRAGSPGLGLGATTVAELGAQREKLFGRGFWRHQPLGGKDKSLVPMLACHYSVDRNVPLNYVLIRALSKGERLMTRAGSSVCVKHKLLQTVTSPWPLPFRSVSTWILMHLNTPFLKTGSTKSNTPKFCFSYFVTIIHSFLPHHCCLMEATSPFWQNSDFLLKMEYAHSPMSSDRVWHRPLW